MKVIISFLVVSIIVCSCKRDTDLSVKSNKEREMKERYFKLQNKGWKSWSNTQKVADINYTATEVPLAYYILNTQGGDNVTQVDSIEKQNETERIIEFEFLHNEEKDLLDGKIAKMDYGSAIKYLSFNINKDFYIVTAKKDTIKCEGVLYERAYKVTPSSKLLLFFSGVDPKQSIQLIYDDKLFGQGVMKFNFKEKITRILL